MNKIPQYIFIHHTALSREVIPNQWKRTEVYHKSKGWGTGGYNYEISAAGGVHQFRGDGTYTAAQYQKNMNDGRALSIALDGNFDKEHPTEKQMEALRKLVKEKMSQYGIQPKNIKKHRDISSTHCPGLNIPEDVYSWLFPKPKGINQVSIRLYKEKGGADIFLIGKDGLYHHIENEETFKYLFGGFKNAVWDEGPRPLPNLIGKSISNR